jgi:putative CocE/NonD family hydrolase
VETLFRWVAVGTIAVALWLCAAGRAAGEERLHDRPTPKHQVRVEKSVPVPMRDGVRLSTDFYFPEGVASRLPVILMRTPYDKNKESGVTLAARMFAGQGYAVALQDKRGKFESEGSYVVSAADTNDGYDAVDWLARQPWSTGKIGTYGCSYLGENQVQMAKLRHPNHVAMIPQASGGAGRYFALITGGAVELASGADWFATNGAKVRPVLSPRDDQEGFARAAKVFKLAPELPPVDWARLWRSLPLRDVVTKAGAPPSDWEDFISHVPGDAWWDQFGYVDANDRFDTPALFVDSWYDYGPADTFALAELWRTNGTSERTRNNVFVVVAPTTHCVYARDREQTIVGQRDVGDARFDFYGLYLRWFDYWLKGIDNGVTRMPKVQIFVMGKNQWRGEEEWPLARTEFTRFYLRSDGRANSRTGTGLLSTDPPGAEPSDRFVYDPASPVPSTGGPDFGTPLPGRVAGAADQSDLEMRQDVLVYTTPPLENGLEITGPLELVLFVSSSAPDTDFTAKLVDVYPDGRAFNVQEGVLRARYREGFDKKVFMQPGGIYRVRVSLSVTSNYFGPGHRIRLEVSSSNFPRFDRNLNTGGRNYDETEWIVAENEIHHSGEHASYLMLPVIPEDRARP